MSITDIVSHKTVYSTDDCALYCGDSLKLLKKVTPNSIDMIFADPPYFLSNGGQTCHSGRAVSVDKGEWDKADSFRSKHRFNREWIRLCKDALTESGTIWISGTYHNIYSIGVALEEEGFRILNNITWQKRNPPPNLACRCFTHSTETIIWACKKSKKEHHIFHYQLMKELNGGKQMKDVWDGPQTPPQEKKLGKHPTQKPLYILERIISASTNPGDKVLDPFCGSSSTGVAAISLGRQYIGIDNEKEFIDLSIRRLQQMDRQ
jgi:site-specific DNA-methyltransferase (adenine-specific)